MRTSYKMWQGCWLAALLIIFIAIVAPSSFASPQAPNPSDVPVVKGGAGSCTADFVVKDPDGKAIYNAKIEILIKYGFMGLHKLDATTPTNVDGKARFEGLPEQIKGTAEFQITHGDQNKSLPFDPQSDCHSHHEIVLGEK
jgi:hypothetical protein